MTPIPPRTTRRLLAVAVLLTAAAAQAQFLPYRPPIVINVCQTPPDLAKCQSPAYQSGPCWSTYRDTCRNLLKAEYSRQHDALPLTNSTSVPVAGTLSRAGAQVTTKLHAPSFAGYYASGMSSSYSGSVSQSQLLAVRPSDPMTVPPRIQWMLNGNQVTGCQEYVHERYMNFGAWEDLVNPYANDFIARFALAYWGEQPIAYQRLRSKDGTDRGDFPWLTASQPKNPYHQALPLQLPGGTASSLAWWNARTAAGRSWGAWNWDRHYSTGLASLGSFTADKMEDEYQLAQQFDLLVRERNKIYDSWVQATSRCGLPWYLGPMPADQCKALTDSASSQLVPLDFGIAVSLTEAERRGCLDTSRVTACDWSPKFFSDTLQQRLSTLREPDQKRCVQMTQNRFGSGLVKQAKEVGLGPTIPPADWTANTTTLTDLFARTEALVAAINMPVDPVTKKPTLSTFKSDSSSIGSEWFGARYNYEAGWGLTNFAAPQRMCEAQFQAKANLDATATVLKFPIEVVNIHASATTYSMGATNNETWLNTVSHTRLLGEDIYTPVDEWSPLQFNLVAEAGRGFRVTPVDNIYIVVLGIPVKLAGGVSGGVGLKATLKGGIDRDCGPKDTIGLRSDGAVAPYGYLDAFAQASVDAYVLEVGIRGQVTLVRLDVPLTAQVKVAMNSSGVAELTANTRLDFKLRTLDGRITVFADSLLKSYEMDLVRWSGPEVSTRLFELNYAPVPISLVKQKLDL